MDSRLSSLLSRCKHETCDLDVCLNSEFCSSHHKYNTMVKDADIKFKEWKPSSEGAKRFKNKIEELEQKFSYRERWINSKKRRKTNSY